LTHDPKPAETQRTGPGRGILVGKAGVAGARLLVDADRVGPRAGALAVGFDGDVHRPSGVEHDLTGSDVPLR
jgi:hypothetical protein